MPFYSIAVKYHTRWSFNNVMHFTHSSIMICIHWQFFIVTLHVLDKCTVDWNSSTMWLCTNAQNSTFYISYSWCLLLNRMDGKLFFHIFFRFYIFWLPHLIIIIDIRGQMCRVLCTYLNPLEFIVTGSWLSLVRLTMHSHFRTCTLCVSHLKVNTFMLVLHRSGDSNTDKTIRISFSL